jgi:hypothetical protein
MHHTAHRAMIIIDLWICGLNLKKPVWHRRKSLPRRTHRAGYHARSFSNDDSICARKHSITTSLPRSDVLLDVHTRSYAYRITLENCSRVVNFLLFLIVRRRVRLFGGCVTAKQSSALDLYSILVREELTESAIAQLMQMLEMRQRRSVDSIIRDKGKLDVRACACETGGTRQAWPAVIS